jgi:four helix bundle protein
MSEGMNERMNESEIRKADFIEAFKDRTKRFALNSIFVFRQLPKTEEAKIIGRQFLRSATSVASNYRAACRARSKAEFFAKLSITVEEADETLFWIELIIESEIGSEKLFGKLHTEMLEILSVLSKARKTVRF